MKSIVDVASKLELKESELDFYGRSIAKINKTAFERVQKNSNGKLILVTAITPTAAGEGKTTLSIGLLDAFFRIGKKAALSLREPSMGPVFGLKGGATGGGMAQIIPSNEINLHFTGDFHAITSANNLLCALVDNHIYQGNSCKINPKTITIKRCLDVNDRTLRHIIIGLGSKVDGVTRQDGFTITAASEIMAIVCLSSGLNDLKRRISNILIGFTFDGNPVYVKDLKIEGAITVVLKNAIYPNLVQTLEGNPVLIHGGPFANIAHGCCSIMATKLALKIADFTITEAGFGADLGAEKFCDIKCRVAQIKPDCAVLVTTIKALKNLGELYSKEDSKKLKYGILENLKIHITNLRKFGVDVVVAINRFDSDAAADIAYVKDYCEKEGCYCEECDVYGQGGVGAIGLAKKVVEICDKPNRFSYLYDMNQSLEYKIETICCRIYGVKRVEYSKIAKQKMNQYMQMDCDKLPICVCKTPYSLSGRVGDIDNDSIEITDMFLAAGAGFVVVLTESVMTLPGLGKNPAANSIDIDDNGQIYGIY